MPATEGARSQTILMIEDDKEFVEDFRSMLASQIFPAPVIHVEGSIDAALERLGNTQFLQKVDLITIDLKLDGGRTGFEAVEQLRSVAGLKAGMVVLTDLDDHNIWIGGRKYEATELLNRGVSQILSKSVLFTRDIREVYESIFPDRKVEGQTGLRLRRPRSDDPPIIPRLGDALADPIPAATTNIEQRESLPLQLAAAASAIPYQVIAPIRVEERDGRISLVHSRSAVLFAKDRDFEQWRVPVVAHIQEELREDFAHGTNHVRVRERLMALLDLVNLPLPEVKDRQFELGYSIQRFRALVAVYRTAEGDMPALRADILADLELLSGSLELGLSKLELWDLFSTQVANVPPEAIPESVEEVGQALDTIVQEMEKAPSYFDPEVPRTFRLVTESVRDPIGASKAIIFGAVRSLENLLIEASRRLVQSLQKAAENVETVVASKATIIIAGVLVAGGTSLLGLVPAAGTWLKPVMDLAKRLLGAG